MMDSLDTCLVECLDKDADAKHWRQLRRLLHEQPDRVPDVLMLLREEQALQHLFCAKHDASFIEDVLHAVRDDSNQFVARVKRDVGCSTQPSWWQRWPAWAAAAGILMAAGLGLFLTDLSVSTSSAEWTVVVAEGVMRMEDGQAVGVGTPVNPGAELTLAADGRLVLETRGGTRVTAQGGSRLRLADAHDSEKLEVIQGGVYCVHETHGASWPFVMRTANGLRIETLGTRFEVRVSPGIAEVRLEQGQLALKAGNQRVTLNKAPQAIVFREDGFSEPAVIPVHRVAEWKFGELPLQMGPVLFEDTFENDLRRWKLLRLAISGEAANVRETLPASDAQELSLGVPNDRSGRASVLSCQLPYPATFGYFFRPQIQGRARGYREEYDLRLGENGYVEHTMFTSLHPFVTLPVDPDATAMRAVQSGQWYRMRKDYRWRLDEQGQGYWELRAYVNESIFSHLHIFTDMPLFGFGVMSGHVQFDNYILYALTHDGDQ